MKANKDIPDMDFNKGETPQQLWDRAYLAGKGVERLSATTRKTVVDMLCVWKNWRTFDEIKASNNTRMLAGLADLMNVIDEYVKRETIKALQSIRTPEQEPYDYSNFVDKNIAYRAGERIMSLKWKIAIKNRIAELTEITKGDSK